MNELEVDINTTGSKAVIEGKTSLPFRTLVTLILQRKVQALFKKSADEPVIIGSELLTALASAPGDTQEDRGKLVLVTFGVGNLAGVFISALALLVLTVLKISITSQDLGIVLGVIAGVAILGVIIQRKQRRSVFTEKLREAMERTTEMLP